MTQKCSDFQSIIFPERNTKEIFIERSVVVVENRFSWPITTEIVGLSLHYLPRTEYDRNIY